LREKCGLLRGMIWRGRTIGGKNRRYKCREEQDQSHVFITVSHHLWVKPQFCGVLLALATSHTHLERMFPIRDHNPSHTVPWVTYALIALNVAVYLYGVAYITTPAQQNELYFYYAMIPARLTEGQGYETLVTSVFLHAGFMHLAGNMLFLWIFGDNMEDEMGHLPFLAFYLASGAGAAYAQYLAGPGSPVPTVGASGAIAGVMGGYLLLFPKAKVDILLILIVFFRVFPVPAFIMLGLWFGLQLFQSIGSDTTGGGVAYWAHSGGFIVGIILTLPLWWKLGGTAFWNKTKGHPPYPEAQYTYVKSSVPVVRRNK